MAQELTSSWVVAWRQVAVQEEGSMDELTSRWLEQIESARSRGGDTAATKRLVNLAQELRDSTDVATATHYARDIFRALDDGNNAEAGRLVQRTVIRVTRKAR